MRHAAGQLADGLHFLGLAKLLFQLPVFGDVAGIYDNESFARKVRNAFGDGLQDLPFAVVMPEAKFHWNGLVRPGQGALKCGGDTRHVFGVDEIAGVAVDDLLDVVAQYLLNGRALEADYSFVVDDRDEVGGIFRKQAEPFLAGAQNFGRIFSVGYVFSENDDAGISGKTS